MGVPNKSRDRRFDSCANTPTVDPDDGNIYLCTVMLRGIWLKNEECSPCETYPAENRLARLAAGNHRRHLGRAGRDAYRHARDAGESLARGASLFRLVTHAPLLLGPPTCMSAMGHWLLFLSAAVERPLYRPSQTVSTNGLNVS